MGALVVAMRAHPAMERVQAYGCGLLALLCEREDRLRLATEVGAIEAVLAAMRAHEGAIEIQSSGCMAIGQYSSTPERAREVHYTLALVPIPIPMQPSLRSHSSVVASRFFLTLTHTHALAGGRARGRCSACIRDARSPETSVAASEWLHGTRQRDHRQLASSKLPIPHIIPFGNEARARTPSLTRSRSEIGSSGRRRRAPPTQRDARPQLQRALSNLSSPRSSSFRVMRGCVQSPH